MRAAARVDFNNVFSIIEWLISPEGQKAIAEYKIGGEQLFYPNADDAAA